MLVLSALAALCLLIYHLGLDGPFLFDDSQNIVRNPAVQPAQFSWDSLVAAWGGNHSGPLGRPLASLSFALNYLAGGLDPSGYKQVNVVLHLVTGLAVFGLLRSLLLASALAGRRTPGHEREIERTALLAAALWLLAPLHVSTVLYVVQRMTILSALPAVLALWAYSHGRRRQLQGQPGWLWLLLVMPALTLTSVLSKETGALVPLLCAVCEWSLLGFRATAPRTQFQFRALYIGVTLAIVLAGLYYRTTVLDILQGGYHSRPFTLEQRLLTEARILWTYLGMLLAPDTGLMNLYHDDVVISTGWLSPATTLPAALGIVVSGMLALGLARKAPVCSFAILFFLAGHLLESSVVPLELMFEHRNYLPSLGLMLLIASALVRLSQRLPALAVGLTAVLLIANLSLLSSRCLLFADEFRLLLHSLEHHPRSVRTQLWAGDYYKLLSLQGPPSQAQALRARGLIHYRESARLDPAESIGLMEVLIWDAQQGRPPQAGVIADLAQRFRQQPASAGTINGVLDFSREITERGSRFPPQAAIEMLSALLENPSLSGQNLSTVLAAIAALQWHAGSREVARATYARALLSSPSDPYLWLTIAATDLQSGHLDEARQALAKARQYDGGELREGLDLLAADIEAAASRPDASQR